MNGNPGRTAPAVEGTRGRIRTAFQSLTGGLNAVGTFWIFVLMVLMNADIIGRDLFNAPVRGVTEIVSLSIVAIVFLQLADTLRTGRLTRAESIIGPLMSRRPRLAHAMLGLWHVTGAVLLAVIFNASLPSFTESWTIGEYVGAVGDFTAPTWPVRLIILIGSAATALQFLAMAWDDVRVVLRRPA